MEPFSFYTCYMKLYDIMRRKERVSSIFLNTLKETAIDCKHNCFTTKSKNEFLTQPDYTEEKLTAFKKVTKKTEYAKKTIDNQPVVIQPEPRVEVEAEIKETKKQPIINFPEQT